MRKRLIPLLLIIILFSCAGSKQTRSGKWISLFDGKSLTGWEGDPKIWRIQDGLITGGSLTETVKRNEFLATTKDFGNFIIPIGDKKFRLGATHELEPTHIQPTVEGIAELKNSLEAVFPKPFQVLDHEAGYRPTTHDRKPVVGIHPHHPNLGLFNGLGARGVLQAPLIAMEFMDYLLHDKPLPKEIDILRYFKKK